MRGKPDRHLTGPKGNRWRRPIVLHDTDKRRRQLRIASCVAKPALQLLLSAIYFAIAIALAEKRPKKKERRLSLSLQLH